jgi:P pilus assembly chaperone PapD
MIRRRPLLEQIITHALVRAIEDDHIMRAGQTTVRLTENKRRTMVPVENDNDEIFRVQALAKRQSNGGNP